MRAAIAMLVLVLLSGNPATQAQEYERCLTHSETMRALGCSHEELQQWIETNYAWQQTDGTIAQDLPPVLTIPVVFHVLYRTPEQNVSEERLLEQVEILNRDFRKQNADTINLLPAFAPLATDARVEFCLASRDPWGQETNGITRRATNVFRIGVTQSYYRSSEGGTDAWPAQSYLNFWVCELPNAVLGYTFLPGSVEAERDGIVMNHNHVGRRGINFLPYNGGRTAVHEVGHWLGLLHPWGLEEGCDTDDGVADTPIQLRPNGECSNQPKITCNNGPVGDLFMNYMDYTGDNCQYMFSRGQVELMWRSIEQYRGSLRFSDGCGTGQPLPGSSQLEIYPVPVYGHLNLSLSWAVPGETKVQVFSASGELLLEQNLGVVARGNFEIATPWEAGTYILRISNDALTLTRRFVKIGP